MNQPTVAVIIPCRNEEKYIKKCVVSLLKNTYPQNLISIYVCDGLSDDSSREIVQEISNQNSNVFLIDNEKQTTPFALNLGLKKANTDIKIILGAHSQVDENFIVENVNAFNIDSNIGCTGGVIENVYENSASKTIGLAMSSPFGVGNAHFRTGAKSGFVDTAAFGAYKQEVFNKIGYFDEDLTRNQDDEFNFRVIKNDFKIYLSEKIKCKYFVRGSFKKLFRQYYQYGYWKVFVNKKHKTVTTTRQLIPLLFVLFLIFGGGLSLIHPYVFYGYLSILSIYVLSALFAAIQLNNNIIKLVFTFFILHLSYGWGYFLGIIDFLILGKQPGKSTEKLSR